MRFKVMVICLSTIILVIFLSNVFNTTIVLSSSSYSKYIGNRNSMIVHKWECEWQQKMHWSNKVFFDNVNEALSQGYRPCKVCNPKPESNFLKNMEFILENFFGRNKLLGHRITCFMGIVYIVTNIDI